MGTRDRDLAGRPRNSRPRDELGRPLPRTALARGAGPADAGPGDAEPADAGPEGAGPEPAEPGAAGTPAEAAGIGGRLLLDGRPFQAHEVFEDAWKAAPASDRDLWRGLAQIAVGLTHARRGNPRGAVALLRRGAGNLRGYCGDPAPYGIDVALVAVRAEEVAGRIERDGLDALPLEVLLLPLGPQLPSSRGPVSPPASRSPAWRPGRWRWRRRTRRLSLPRW